MMSKIINSLNSINKFSTNIIKVGSFISLALCLIGMILIGYNNTSLHEIYAYTLGSNMISSAIMLFAEVVIGSIIIDFFGHMANGDD